MSASILVEGHSISGMVVPQQNDSYPAAKLPHARGRSEGVLLARTHEIMLVRTHLRMSQPLN